MTHFFILDTSATLHMHRLHCVFIHLFVRSFVHWSLITHTDRSRRSAISDCDNDQNGIGNRPMATKTESGIQGGPAKVKPTYFTHQNAQTRYYSTVLFYKKKQVVIRKNIINAKANKYQQNQTILP